jgi:hypothetical protein
MTLAGQLVPQSDSLTTLMRVQVASPSSRPAPPVTPTISQPLLLAGLLPTFEQASNSNSSH